MTARYWIGESELDRWVLRSLKRFSGASPLQVHAEVCRRLRQEDIVKIFQILPSEEDVWCALQRLVRAKSAQKYVLEHGADRSIRYRVSVMK